MTTAAALVGDLLSDEDARAEAAVPALALFGEAALDLLLPLLRSQEAETRWWAVRATAAIPAPRAAAGLTTSLEDDDPAVRQAAALGLRLQPTPDAIPALVGRLADSDRLTARLASDALAAIGPGALPETRRALASEAPATRLHAARAIALMKTKEAIPDLFAVLDDDSTLVRHWAERGLEALGVGMVFFQP